MKKIIILMISSFAVFIFIGCSSSKVIHYPDQAPSNQKDIPQVRNYQHIFPQRFTLIDFDQKARDFHQWLFDGEAHGDFLPLIWENDQTGHFGFGAFVGDERGFVEGVSAIAAVLSATLLGIDMTEYNGRNYVARLSQFYNSNQGVILNNVGAESLDNSLWYKIYPGILFTQVSLMYPEETTIRDMALSNIEQWYQAHLVFEAQENGPNYAFTSFDFTSMTPYFNGIWREPDSAVGIAMLMYYGYQITQDEKYLTALIQSMNFAQNYFSSPLYEILHFYAPYLAAYLNANHGTNFDVLSFLNENFDGSSVPRGGWGSIVGTWGQFPMDGLKGSIRDRGGYAFSMNTFASAFIVSSFLPYDTRFASSIGQWLLHLVSNSRFFFPDQSDPHFQSCTPQNICGDFNTITNNSFPYEGIINGFNGRTPWIGGDPLIEGWALTDLSIYSGVSTGMLASMIASTNVEGILRLQVNRMASISQDIPPVYLLFNPHPVTHTVDFTIDDDSLIDAFDLVSKTYLRQNQQESFNITLEPLESVLIATLPAGTLLTHDGLRILMPNGKVLTTLQMTAHIQNVSPLQRVSGETDFTFVAVSDVLDDAIASIDIRVGSYTFSVENSSTITVPLNEVPLRGNRRINFKVTMTSGLSDEGSIILHLE